MAATAVTALEIDAGPAARGAREFAAAAEQVKAANRGMIDTSGRLQKTVEDTGKGYQRLRREIDPVGAAQEALSKKLARGISLIENERTRARITDQQAAQDLARLNDVYAQQSARLAAAASGQEEATRAAAQLAAANDNLRARYVPLHAVQQQYLASLREIRAAATAGVLSQQESAAAITRTKDAFAAQVRTINGVNPALQRGAGAARNMGAAVQQAGFQIGDFAVQVASGQGLLRPFIQQGTQLISMFGPWGAAIGAAGAVVGALATYLLDAEDGMEKVAKAAGVSKSAIDEYRESILLLERARKGEQVSERDLEDRLNSMSLEAVKAALQVEEQRQEVLRKQIVARRELLAIQQPAGEMQSPDDVLSTQQTSAELNGLNRSFEDSIDRSDRLFSRLTALDLAIAKIGPSANRTKFEQDQLNRSIERATELAHEHDQALLAARDRTKVLLDDRDRHIASVEKEIDDSGRLRAALAQGTRAYEVMAAQIALMSANRLLDADAARALAERSVDSARALDRERTAIEMRNAAAGAGRVADAYLGSQAAGLAAEARREATQENLRNGVDIEARSRQILSRQIDESIVQGATQIHQLEQEAVHRRAVAAAAGKGVDALRQAELQARIEQATQAEHMALAHADAEQRSRLTAIIIAKTTAITGEAQATRDLADAQSLQQQAEQLTMLEAQTRLLGASNEERAVQIARVQALIDLHKREGDALSENERRYLDQAEAIARGTTALERQKSAIEELGNFFSQTFDRVGSAITEGFAKGERSAIRFGDIARGVASEAVQWFLKLGALNPLKNALTGSDLPTIGSMLGAAAPAAAGAAAGGSGPGSFFGPITNAISSGFSSVTSGISSFLFGTAAADISGGIGAITTAGTPGLFGTYGAGASTFAAAAPWIAAAAAIAIPLLSGMFGRKPSVGKTSVGRITDLTDPDSTVFTFDNKGSDTSVLTGVIKAVTDAIESGTERFLGTLRPGAGFDFGYFPSPESGNSQPGGINIKAIIGSVLEDKDRFKGLSEQEAVDKATLIALREMVDYQSATLDEIAANSDATTSQELIADLEFGRNFDRLTQALADLGGVVDANTLATAQYTVALQARADEFGLQNAAPIADTLEKARALFPARRTGEETRSITETGVYVADDFDEGAARGRRFVAEGTPEFDRLTSGPDPLRAVTRTRSVTEEVDEQSANYAENMERIRQSTEIAGAAAELLAQQVSGAFEPELRGPVQTQYEQGRANLEALAAHFEDVNEQIRLANEEFPGLNAALIDTTALLTEAQATLLANAQAARTENRQQALNAATGLGAANTIAGLVDARDVSLAEDTALGIADGLTGQVFDAQVRQALEGASLTQLGDILKSGQIVDAGARALVETILAEQALAAVRETELAGLQDLHAATKGLAQAANDNARQLRQAKAALEVDRALSPLSPLARLQEANRQLEAAFATANDNDPTDRDSQDAIARLPDLVRTGDELARDYYASSQGYSQQFARGQEILGSTALRQESIEQQQLGALRDIEAAIVANGGVVANDNRSPAERAAESGFNFGTQVERNQRIYDNLVANGLPTPNGFGGGIAGNLGELRAQNPAVDALVTAMGYANGGAFAGGVPVSLFGAGGDFGAGDVFDRPTAFGMRGGLGVMGEAGPEAIMPLERIGGRLGVRALLPANDQGAAISGIRDLVDVLRADNAALRAEIALLREVVAEAGDIGAEATRGVSRTLVRGQRDTRQRRRLGAAAA